jgi:hypothetical protein
MSAQAEVNPMTEERDEKDLTGDLAVDDESASEVTGGREASLEKGEAAHASLADMVADRTTSRRFKSRWFRR